MGVGLGTFEAVAQWTGQPEVLFGRGAARAPGDYVFNVKLCAAQVLAGQAVATAIARCSFDTAT